MDNSGQSSENWNVEGNVDNKGQAHEISLGKRTTLEAYLEAMLHSGKELVFIYPHSKTLCQHELNGSELINLVEKFQHSPKFGLWYRYCWRFYPDLQ